MQAAQKPFSPEEMKQLVFNRSCTIYPKSFVARRGYVLAIDIPLRPAEKTPKFSGFIGFSLVRANIGSNNTGVKFICLTNSRPNPERIVPKFSENGDMPGCAENALGLINFAAYFANVRRDVDTDALRRILRGTL
jgi:hypothetical protein